MTFFRVLLIGLILLIAAIGAASTTIYLRSSQQFLTQQLALHAQDSVTSLGLSLQPVLGSNDWVLAQSIIDSSFDQGDYHLLRLTSIDGEHKLERSRTLAEQRVPFWFDQLLPLEAPLQQTEINSQWQLVATLELQVSDVASKQLLWNTTKHALLALLLIAFVAMVLGSWVLKRLLRPLKLAQQQANGLRKHQYLRQKHIPHIKETADLVHTMNLMVDNSESMFKQQSIRMERLRKQTMLDEDTGLANQRRYQQRLGQALKDREHHHGVLLRVHLDGLSQVEMQHGIEAERKLLAQLAQDLEQFSLQLPEGRSYRIGFAEFAILFPSSNCDDVAQLELPYRQQMTVQLRQLGGERVVIAACNYQIGETPEQLERKLEQTMLEGLSQQDGDSFRSYQKQAAPKPFHYQQQLLDRLLTTTPKLLVQDNQTVTGELLHQEVLVRLNDGENEFMPNDVMALVIRQQRYKQFDLWVLTNLIEQLKHRSNSACLSWNITAESLLDGAFITQIKRHLAGKWEQVAIEIPQRALLLDEAVTKQAINTLAAAGAQLWLDHTTPAGVGLMAQPGLAGIKLDPSYTQEFADNGDLLELMVATAHCRGIKVAAQQTESEDLAKRLWQLGFDGVQGYAVAQPKPLTT